QAAPSPGQLAGGAGIQAGQPGFREDHLGEQVVNEARLADMQAGQQLARQTQLLADAQSQRIELAVQLRRAGQIESAQLTGALVAVAGEGQLDEQAQRLAQPAQLMGEIQDAAASGGVPFQMHALDDLAGQAAQQLL